MNFSFSADQLAIQQSAERVFTDFCSDDAIKALAKQKPAMHTKLWAQLAETGIFSLPFDESYGGMGLVLVELCLVIELQGKSVAPIPLISCVIEAGMSIADSNNTALKERVLPDLISGQLILASAKPYQGLQDVQALQIRSDTAQLTLNGRSGFVAYAGLAGGYLVQANDAQGKAYLLYCNRDAVGLSVTQQTSISDEPAGYLEFEEVKITAENIVAHGAEVRYLVDLQRQRTWVALAAMQVGALDEALKRTASYLSERKQFGRVLGAFQAVSQRAADTYMEIEALRSVYWRALDDIENDQDFAVSAAITKYWVAETGHRASHSVLHLHGGIGQDLDYPIHRFFLYAKQCERYLGSANDMAAQLGKMLLRADSEELAALCL